MIVTRDNLMVALRRVGLIASVQDGYFDKLLGSSDTPSGQGLVIQYSETGVGDWSLILDPTKHAFWRWSTDGGVSFSPDSIRFKPEVSPSADMFGWFNYSNTIAQQTIPANTWTTLMNTGAGSRTDSKFKPNGIDTMLDGVTGNILLDQLRDGDEVYIRYVLNVIPKSNNTQYRVSHLFGEGAQEDRRPVGQRVNLNEGAGVPTQQFLLDSHFYVDTAQIRQAGLRPQIFATNELLVEYQDCYISVTRR